MKEERDGAAGRDGEGVCVLARPKREVYAIEQSGSVYLIPREGKPVRLNFAASFLWRELGKASSPEEMIAGYARVFDADSETANADVHRFLKTMREGGYLVSSDGQG